MSPAPDRFEWPALPGRALFLVILLVACASAACRTNGSDGDADADADGDGDLDGGGDADADLDGDQDADDDGQVGCYPPAGGACDPIAACGCGEGELCDIVLNAAGDAAEEGCMAGEPGEGVHEEACPCAEGYLCFDPGVCLQLCIDHEQCPERSLCDTGFLLSEEVRGDPYWVCSPRGAEAEAGFSVCVAAAGACPGAGATELALSANEGATWSCAIDATGGEEATLSFEISDGSTTLRGTNLVFPIAASRLVPASCEAFEVTTGGDTFSATECIPGLPTAGSCVMSIDFKSGQVNASFRCLEIPGPGAELLSTMNGADLGGGSFALRSCTVTE